MWYKEWRQARFKILAAILTYGLVSLYAITSWYFGQYSNGLLDQWYAPAMIATGALAALAGIDVVSEEKDRGTLSFLLTRPIKRNYIYKVKLLINLSWLSATYGIFSLVILALSQIKLFHVQFFSNLFYLELYNQQYVGSPVQIYATRVWRPSESITALFLVLMLGLAITCYTAFISIFARSTIETIVFSGLIGLGTIFLAFMTVAVLNKFFYHNQLQVSDWFRYPTGVLLISLFLGLLAALFYGGGRTVFTRKEF